MKEPNLRVEFYKADFSLSPQVSAEATATTILGIDFERLFMKQTANSEVGSSGISLATLPVIGNVLGDKTSGYALYELLNSNQGYDVIFYPQYETKVVRPLLGLGFLMKTTTVKTTARLGKLN
ncbi:MAG: hypothetical protein JJT94_09500 [Bernardetiaceae bacterium]|nr:hypothetical protein [Bernardetiaceae bacterium]